MNDSNKRLLARSHVYVTMAMFVAALLCGCGGGGSAGASPPPPPPTAYEYRLPANNGDTWSIADAGTNGLDTALLENMMNDIRAGLYPAVDSISIAKDGALVFDETIRTSTELRDTWVDNTDPAIHAMFSVSKSITSLLVGIAIDDGFIAGIDAPYLSLFPYPSYQNPDPRKGDITLQHVLAMRLGLEWNEWDPPYTEPNNQLNQFIDNEVDYAKALLDLPMVNDPGSRFAYNTAATISLGQAIENSVPMALIDYGLNELILPLGITEIEVFRTPTGLPNGGSGFFMRTRDVLKFGELMLNGGEWNGQRIVSDAWVAASVTPLTDIGWSDPDAWDWKLGGYGYQWWTGHYDFNGAIYDTYAAWGFGGQWVIAIPGLDLVVAVNANGYDGNEAATNTAHALVMNYILPSIQ